MTELSHLVIVANIKLLSPELPALCHLFLKGNGGILQKIGFKM